MSCRNIAKRHRRIYRRTRAGIRAPHDKSSAIAGRIESLNSSILIIQYACMLVTDKTTFGTQITREQFYCVKRRFSKRRQTGVEFYRSITSLPSSLHHRYRQPKNLCRSPNSPTRPPSLINMAQQRLIKPEVKLNEEPHAIQTQQLT